jgi:hypothetical protein
VNNGHLCRSPALAQRAEHLLSELKFPVARSFALVGSRLCLNMNVMIGVFGISFCMLVTWELKILPTARRSVLSSCLESKQEID